MVLPWRMERSILTVENKFKFKKITGGERMDNKLDISKMSFDYIDKAACYTGNNSTNKGMKAITTHKILSAVMEMKDNINNRKANQ